MTFRSYGPDGPSIAARRTDLTISGHVIDVTIKRAGGETVAASQPLVLPGRGLIDTGASDVCIDYRMAEELGLRKVDEQTVGVVGGTVPAAIYMGILEIPELEFSELMPLFALRVRRPTHDILLGRSFLQNFTVTFDGPNGIFHFVRSRFNYELPDFDE